MGTFRDTTEQHLARERERDLNSELHKQSRLAALGTLAQGIGHEINNPVTGIMNYAQLILDEGREGKPNACEHAVEIIAEAQRIARLVADLMQFVRDPAAPELLNGINVIHVFVCEINRFLNQPGELIHVLRIGE